MSRHSPFPYPPALAARDKRTHCKLRSKGFASSLEASWGSIRCFAFGFSWHWVPEGAFPILPDSASPRQTYFPAPPGGSRRPAGKISAGIVPPSGSTWRHSTCRFGGRGGGPEEKGKRVARLRKSGWFSVVSLAPLCVSFGFSTLFNVPNLCAFAPPCEFLFRLESRPGRTGTQGARLRKSAAGSRTSKPRTQ
jgi:hypothetical protein